MTPARATMLERATLAATASAIGASLVGTGARWPVLTTVGSAVALSAIRVALDRYRWQMVPAYLAATGLGVAATLGAEQGGATIGWVGAGTAAIGVALAAGLTAGLPLPRLPAPDGPLGVGTISTRLARPIAGSEPRDLDIKVWYPAPAPGEPGAVQREPLWAELHGPRARGIPRAMRLLSRYLRRVPTHSIPDAPICRGDAPSPVVVYHHGLISFGSDNTLLAESLASHGYVVAAVRHVDQLKELRQLNANSANQEPERIAELNRRLAGNLSRAERAELSHELYELSIDTAMIVARRAADSARVLDSLDSIMAAIPGYTAGDRPTARTDRVGAAGLSLGGAVATEWSKIDQRVAAVVNLDGGMFSPQASEPITVPYLMLYSELNTGGNDRAATSARAAFTQATIGGAKHLDFHDAPAVLPILGWVGQLGSIRPAAATAAKTNQVRQFFDDVLRAPIP